MIRTKLLKSGRAQVVLIPNEVAFPGMVEEVVIVKDGMRRLLVPVNAVWDDFFDAAGSDIPNREQPRIL